MRQASSIPKDDLGVASPMAKALKSGASQKRRECSWIGARCRLTLRRQNQCMQMSRCLPE